MTYLSIKLAIAVTVGLTIAARGMRDVLDRARSRQRMRAGAPQLEDASLVTLEGTVEPLDGPLVAPLSGKRCVAYFARARCRGSRKARAPSVTVVREQVVPFRLVTPAGEVIVDVTKAELAIRPGAVVPQQLERERDFLVAAEVTGSPREFGFEEIAIEPGARIKVHGIGRIDVEPGAAGFREVPRVSKIIGDERHPVTISER
jgi:hypothetical protein